MYVITIDQSKCTGDGDCVDACPVTILGLVDGKATLTGDPAECLGCEACSSGCVGEAITVQDL